MSLIVTVNMLYDPVVLGIYSFLNPFSANSADEQSVSSGSSDYAIMEMIRSLQAD